MKDFQSGITRYEWKEVKNVANPEKYVDDFSTDNGYFTEEDGAHDWKIENGVLRTEVIDRQTLTYLHIFEKNVIFKARIKITEVNPPDALFGMLLRYNSDAAYCRFTHFFKSGVWMLDVRDGADFPPIRHAYKKPHLLEADRWYDICFTADGTDSVLTIDGEEIFRASGISHTSPGRVAIFTDRLALDVDSVDVTFLSGQGTLWSHVRHTKLPDDRYREGGSVFEMNDGSLIYTHHSGVTFKSCDNGTSWERTEKWTDTYGYVNILRLNNGDFMKIAYRQYPDGKRDIISQTSSDDGKTWIDGGFICKSPYKGNTDAGAGNMNDKLNQTASGRIFYSQNYEDRKCVNLVNGYLVVFCEFYYSDDNGKTWTKSNTDSWELPGNENQSHFGECKILECADGTMRMYNSWNKHGCIVYSESKDGGATWGPLTPIPELVCSLSSMQFFRDTYADNGTTYYMVWVYSPALGGDMFPMTRSRLCLARSTNGKDWTFLGDVWRWEHNYIASGSHIAHVVDAFVKTTKNYVICGAGYSEELEHPGDHSYHHAQRQHVYSIKKSVLTDRELKPVE